MPPASDERLAKPGKWAIAGRATAGLEAGPAGLAAGQRRHRKGSGSWTVEVAVADQVAVFANWIGDAARLAQDLFASSDLDGWLDWRCWRCAEPDWNLWACLATVAGWSD